MLSKRTKLLTTMAITIVMGGTLFGCGNSKEAASNDKELTVWSHLTEQEVKDLKPSIDKWEKDNDAKVNIHVEKDNAEMQQYIQAANSSKGPDVMFGLANDNLGTFQKADLLEEVPSDLVKDEEYTSKQVMDAVTINNKRYALPIAQETLALYYNSDKVKEVPKTMEDLVVQAKDKGFKFDINNFYHAFGFLSAGGGYVFKDNGGKLDPSDIGLGNEGAVKGFQFLQDLVQKNKFMAADINGDISKGDFSSGNCAFYLAGPWDVPAFKESGVNFKVAPLPTLNGQKMKTFLGVQTAFVSATSKKKDLAWKFVKDMSKEGAMTIINTGNRLPVLKEVANSDEYKSNEISKQFLEQAKNAIPMPNIPEVQTMWTPGANNLKQLNAGKITPKECAQTIVEQVKEGIEQQK